MKCSTELRRYHWPGNVRELQNVMERVIIMSGERSLDGLDRPGRRLSPTTPASPMRVPVARTCVAFATLPSEFIVEESVPASRQHHAGRERDGCGTHLSASALARAEFLGKNGLPECACGGRCGHRTVVASITEPVAGLCACVRDAPPATPGNC